MPIENHLEDGKDYLTVRTQCFALKEHILAPGTQKVARAKTMLQQTTLCCLKKKKEQKKRK